MTTRITRLFTEHPQSVDETYFEHMAFAGRFFVQAFLCGLCGTDPCNFAIFVREDGEHNRSPAL
ncbi:Uncharacterised protein [Brucella anthropi]|nr:Uncharacterised protein [Brucella anthropi]